MKAPAAKQPLGHGSINTARVTTTTPDSIVTVSSSLDEFDNEFRRSAIAAVDRYMEVRLTNHSNGWVRWRGFVVNPDDLTNGDYLDADKVVKKFRVEPFSGESFVEAQARFTTRDFTASATWIGDLNDGESGTISVSMQGNIEGPTKFFFRLRTSSGQYTIVPIDFADVYVVAESNVAF